MSDPLIRAIRDCATQLLAHRPTQVEDAASAATDDLQAKGELEAILDGIRWARRSAAVKQRGGAVVQIHMPEGYVVTFEYGAPDAATEAMLQDLIGRLSK